ncbi:OmpA family protein [Sulfitobacter sp. D35]|uniref:OmpA family protein n=1 Tax=Sulfitobacter sp. D35 TaxID=3083252 RepID=UPI00296F91EA|nr:OmpA family protein [Sulfitobacter sp. D35]MDW4500139.1 OmpA family protein [Sulfitobacter sp. D35]
MISSKTSLVFALAGAMALGACTNPGALDGSTTGNQNTQTGALIGAGAGAALGALVGDSTSSAIKGAAVGGAIGAGIGYSLDKQEADLRRQVANSNVQITNTGDRLIVTLPQDILFATDSSAVRPDLQDELRAVAGNLQQYPQSTIQIVGHTDSDGDAAYNQQLSERRAGAVSNVLLNAGVPGNRIQAIGRGETQPVASNLNAAGKAQNRRVEIVILPTAA